ncbi:hypothetical protein AOQ84DRAFT_321313 [Glonium stellatum]|uniref:Uncharacterized protein n=1 Tax=Glonium stellatum TaxID=574774 RepID=A0A8E2JRK4_9PEZI|nr:hypothetical protein AOQ84DRAFT_321313 [Glonium stellatum]
MAIGPTPKATSKCSKASGTLDHMISRKRKSSLVEAENDENDDYSPITTKKPRKAASKSKKAIAEAGTCSLNKKELGDRVKSALRLEKYGTQRTRIDLTMDLAYFNSFFRNPELKTPIDITPSTFDASTPVVVAELGHAQAGELLGVSKVKGGNRMATTYLASMCVVFYPAKGNARV